MANQDDLSEPKAYRLFNHVTHEVTHSDDNLRIDPHLFADETFTVVARHQHDAIQPGGTFDFEFQRQ